jgi:hypothetical protein
LPVQRLIDDFGNDSIFCDSLSESLLCGPKAATHGVQRSSRRGRDLFQRPTKNGSQSERFGLLFGQLVEKRSNEGAALGGQMLVVRCLDSLEVDRIVSMAPASIRPSPRAGGRAHRNASGEVGRIALSSEARQRLNETDESKLRRVIDVRMDCSHDGPNDPNDAGSHEVEQTSRGDDVTGGCNSRKFEGRIACDKPCRGPICRGSAPQMRLVLSHLVHHCTVGRPQENGSMQATLTERRPEGRLQSHAAAVAIPFGRAIRNSSRVVLRNRECSAWDGIAARNVVSG